MPGPVAVTSSPFLNVANYGATGNGSTDDSGAIQSAINLLPSDGGVIYFPPGTYVIGTGLTLPQPTPTSGVYENPITFLGSGAGSTTIQKLNDVILIDASGSIASGTVTMRRGVELRDLSLSGNNIGSQPLIRCYYGLDYRFDRCFFRHNNGGSALVSVQWWDSYLTACWFDTCGGATPTIDQAYNGGTSQNGNECVRLLSAQQYPQVSNSTMGYSTDSTNNIWFVDCEFTYGSVGALYIGQVVSTNGQPHRIYVVNAKFEDSAMQGPFIRAFGAAHVSFTNLNLNCIGLQTITSVDLIHLTNVADAEFSNVYAEAITAYSAARVFSLFGTNDSVSIRKLYSQLTTTGGSGGVAPFNVTGRTTSGNNEFAAAIDFNTNNTNFVIERQLTGSSIRGLPSDAVLVGATANARVATTVTTTSTTMSAVTGLDFGIGAGEIWTATFHLWVTGSAAGMKFNVSGPAAPTDLRLVVFGTATSGTAFQTETLTALATATADAYASGSSAGLVRIDLEITNGSNAGTVQLNFAAVTATQSNSVLIDSFMDARRIG